MAGAAPTNLNYRVFHCSSQDPSFPVGDLIQAEQTSQSELNGWQSQRFCVYPQELVLQFPTLVHLKQVQFLIHQSKIPSRIELYAYAPDLQQQDVSNFMSPHNTAQIAFTRLGHFSLDDNIRTNYQARELKTVYLEQYCQYLKIVLHKNHLNSMNIFNQVGLVQIQCTGGYIGDYEMSAMNLAQRQGGINISGQPLPDNHNGSLMPRNLRLTGVNDEDLDAVVLEKVKVLNEAKLRAVDEEDFDKAKHLKDAIDKLKMAGGQLVQLETQKRLAIENEDFDTAKVLKFEIERLRNMAMNLDTQRVIMAPVQSNAPEIRQHPTLLQEDAPMFTPEEEQHQYAHHNQQYENEQQYYNHEESKISLDQQDHVQFDRNDELHQSLMRQENPLAHSQRQLQHLSSQQITVHDHRSVKDAQSAVQQSKQSFKSSLHEELIVPAVGLKKPIDFNTVGEDELDAHGGILANSKDGSVVEVNASQEELRLSNIPQSQKPIADAMVPLFGEQTACLVFARAWANREKGIQDVISKLDHLMLQSAEAPANNTVLQVLTECLKDKVQQITTKAFQLVEAYISCLQKNKAINPKSDTSNNEKMLVQLLDKLADPKFSKKAEACFLTLFTVEQYDGNYLITFLLKDSTYVNKNLAASFKHSVPRLQIINGILAEFPKYETELKKTNQQTFPFAPLMAKIKEGVDNSNQEHRKVCLQLIVTLYQQFGIKRVEQLIGELPLKHLEVLAKDIPEADAYCKARKHQPARKEL